MRERRINKMIPDDLARKFRVLGEDIAAARKVRRMTQEQFAKALGVSRMTIHRLENGDHNIGFGVVAGAAWLMGLDNMLMNAFAPENDPVARREQRLSLPGRVRSSRARSPAHAGKSLDF